MSRKERNREAGSVGRGPQRLYWSLRNSAVAERSVSQSFSIKSQSAGSNLRISPVVRAELVGNEGFVGIVSDSDRQQNNIPFPSIRIKIYPGQLLGYFLKVKCFSAFFGKIETLFTCIDKRRKLPSFLREKKKSRVCGRMPFLGLTQNAVFMGVLRFRETIKFREADTCCKNGDGLRE